MIELNGNYGKAIVYTDDIEQEAISQIINLLNQPMTKGANVRIMPDVHAGAGCVIGYTAKLTDKVVPNLIGVDIGCGMSAWKLGNLSKIGEKFDKLDKVIRRDIPFGKEVNDSFDIDELKWVYNTLDIKIPFTNWYNKVSNICKKMGQDETRVWNSIGSLGGGNHFIEIDKDDNNDLWLIIHSGSRNFGLKIAKYHQEIAENSLFSISKEDFDSKIKEIKKTKKGKGIEVAIKALKKEASMKGKVTGLEYLEGNDLDNYLDDMEVAQVYAQISRRLMGKRIIENRYKLEYFNPIESVHNYINFDDKIIRKGSISAHEGEKVIIPLNMADGVIIGVGKGNKDWNYSAPHGAGRKMSRSKAKVNIRLEDYQYKMKDVWSSCVGKSTLDEAPQAYKNADHILENIKETVSVISHMKPIYNFKGE